MKICITDPTGAHFGLNSGVGYVTAYLKKYNAFDKIKALRELMGKKGNRFTQVDRIEQGLLRKGQIEAIPARSHITDYRGLRYRRGPSLCQSPVCSG
jgi:hypothetical protein